MTSKDQAIEALKKVEDPEVGIDIWTMGLIYNLELEKTTIKVTMTFTSPTCPYGPQLLEETEESLKEAGFTEVEIHVTFNPVWQPSEELKDLLGMPL